MWIVPVLFLEKQSAFKVGDRFERKRANLFRKSVNFIKEKPWEKTLGKSLGEKPWVKTLGKSLGETPWGKALEKSLGEKPCGKHILILILRVKCYPTRKETK